MKYCNSKSDVPVYPHFAIIEFTSVTIPGDERSRTNPGHGYPEHTDYYSKYIAFTDEAEWKGYIEQHMGLVFSSPNFVALKVTPATIKTEYHVNIV
jgi:hypothetical protein